MLIVIFLPQVVEKPVPAEYVKQMEETRAELIERVAEVRCLTDPNHQ